MLPKESPIPEGWRKGRIGTATDLIWITDGARNKRIPSKDCILEGWKFGRTSKTTSGRVFLNKDGHRKLVDQDEAMTLLKEGWSAGIGDIGRSRQKRMRFSPEKNAQVVAKRKATNKARTGYEHPAQNPLTKTKSALPWLEVESKLRSVHGERYLYDSQSYVNDSAKLRVFCPDHGWFEAILSNLKKGNGCRFCQYDKSKVTLEEWLNRFRLAHGDKYDYSSLNTDNIGSGSYVEIICPSHGIFSQMMTTHAYGSGCPKCFGSVSKIEMFIKDQFEEIGGLKFNLQNVRGVFPEIGKKEIDLVDEKHRVSIEFNGIFWHQILKDKTLQDWEKAEAMRKNGFVHLALNELDIDRLPILIDMASPKKQTIAARKCVIREVSSKEASGFLSDNHLQGACVAPIRFGLWSNDELIQLMTFAKSRFDKSAEWEIVRLASKRGTKVLGGSQRLFKHFLKNHTPRTIVSYSDNRYFSGSVYESLGFRLESNSKRSNYWWVKGSAVLSRHSTKKSMLKDFLEHYDASFSESENMLNHGWNKIYDLGNKKWVWNC